MEWPYHTNFVRIPTPHTARLYTRSHTDPPRGVDRNTFHRLHPCPLGSLRQSRKQAGAVEPAIRAFDETGKCFLAEKFHYFWLMFLICIRIQSGKAYMHMGIMWDFVCILYGYVYTAYFQVSTDVLASQKITHGKFNASS